MPGGAKPITAEEHAKRLQIWQDNPDKSFDKLAKLMGGKIKGPGVRQWAIRSGLLGG